MSDYDFKNNDPELEDDNYDYESEEPQMDAAAARSIKGYRIVSLILVVILIALTALYFNIHCQQQADYALLSVERDSIESNLSGLIVDFDSLGAQNKNMADTLSVERHKADSIITQLKRERSFNYAKLKQYEKEVGTLRTIMKGYLRQIDSLNTLNKKLITENVGYKKEITSAQLRADMAEERATELDVRVRQGSVLRAMNIGLEMLNDRGNDVSRARRAERVRVDFTLAANELTEPGKRTVCMVLTSPDGYVLTTSSVPTFDFEGESMTYTASREMDYQNQDLAGSIYFNSEGFVEGTYKIALYADGNLIGSNEIYKK